MTELPDSIPYAYRNYKISEFGEARVDCMIREMNQGKSEIINSAEEVWRGLGIEALKTERDRYPLGSRERKELQDKVDKLE